MTHTSSPPMSRPFPHPTPETQPFWDGCAQHELRFQRCAHCGETQLIPRAVCAACHRDDGLHWHVSQGLGRVLSFTHVHRAPTPVFKADVPYTIALVDMAEGFRLMVNVHGRAGVAITIGDPVRIGFRQQEGVTLPEAQVLA